VDAEFHRVGDVILEEWSSTENEASKKKGTRPF